MIPGLPPKSQQIRLSGDPDTTQTQRALDGIRTPLDAALGFLNAASFKSTLGPVTYTGSYTLGSVQPGQTANVGTFSFVAAFPGSLIGMSMSSAASSNAGIITAAVLKNGSTLQAGVVVQQGKSTGFVAYKMGALPFLAGDVLTVNFTSSIAASYALQAYLTIEMSA